MEDRETCQIDQLQTLSVINKVFHGPEASRRRSILDFQIILVREYGGDSDVGDIMMVTDLRCWWQNHYVGDFFRYVGDFSNVLNRSPAF